MSGGRSLGRLRGLDVMSRIVSSPFVVGPRFSIPLGGESSLLAMQLQRGVRTLVGQRGGVLLMHAWGIGTNIRMECEVSGAFVSLLVVTDDDETAALMRVSTRMLEQTCARCGYGLARVSCAGPASQPMQPAA